MTSSRQLVTDLNSQTAEDLEYLVMLEIINPTTVVNRAIQIYAMLRRAQENGGEILVSLGTGSEPQPVDFA
jgi:hypothetical protein